MYEHTSSSKKPRVSPLLGGDGGGIKVKVPPVRKVDVSLSLSPRHFIIPCCQARFHHSWLCLFKELKKKKKIFHYYVMRNFSYLVKNTGFFSEKERKKLGYIFPAHFLIIFLNQLWLIMTFQCHSLGHSSVTTNNDFE